MCTGREDARATSAMLGAERRDERVVVRGGIEVRELIRGDACSRELTRIDEHRVELVEHLGRAALAALEIPTDLCRGGARIHRAGWLRAPADTGHGGVMTRAAREKQSCEARAGTRHIARDDEDIGKLRREQSRLDARERTRIG